MTNDIPTFPEELEKSARNKIDQMVSDVAHLEGLISMFDIIRILDSAKDRLEFVIDSMKAGYYGRPL